MVGEKHEKNYAISCLALGNMRARIYIDNVLYAISDKKVRMNTLENLDEINELEFP